jgi:aminoglycoside phosphotransferase (APT) family kinase protein
VEGPAAELDSRALVRLADVLSPGSSIANIEALPGGLDAAMCAFELRTPAGLSTHLVLRRYPAHHGEREPSVARRAWRTLSALESQRFPAPLPIWLDDAGEIFGTPAVVMTRIAGRTVLDPADFDVWVAELARSIAGLHAVSVQSDTFNFLPGPGESLSQMLRTGDWLSERTRAHPEAARIVALLRRWQSRSGEGTPVLVHGDFWPGNTIWENERIAAIVDWDSAAIDLPGMDIGYCRLDLALLMGPPAPDRFLEAYERLSGNVVEWLSAWDLVAALRALPDPARWLPGYHGLGRVDVTADLMRNRLSSFIEQALRQSTRQI